MKPLVIYHANCTDGFGAAFAAWTVLGDEAEYLPMRYDEAEKWNTEDGRGRDVYILDFSLPSKTLVVLTAIAKKVVFFDHHKTAFESLLGGAAVDYMVEGKKYEAIYVDGSHFILDNNRSGALIAWEYFNPGTVIPALISHIDDYDRWQFKLDGTKELNKALWSGTPWNFEQWEDLACSDLTPMYKAGKAILRAHDQNVQTVVKGTAMDCTIVDFSTITGWESGHCGDIPHYTSFSGLMSNCPAHLSSDVGHELANQSGTFGLLWSIRKDGKCGCSLRSNGDYDVSAIAKAFGGGGHKNAAGFEVPITTLLSWVKP